MRRPLRWLGLTLIAVVLLGLQLGLPQLVDLGLGGLAVVGDQWVHDVATASRTDIVTPGLTMADVATEIWKRDVERQRDRADARSSYR